MGKFVGLLVEAFLFVFYGVGFVAGFVVQAVVTSGGAVALGWSDARKRGEHGAS